MRTRVFALTAVVALTAMPAAAHHNGTGLPDCVSKVPMASTTYRQVGRFHARGFGGGFIGAVKLPAVQNVVPPPTAQEGDVVAALAVIDFIGVLGGGTTSVGDLVGSTTTHTGAQTFEVGLFTGHYKAVPRSMQCESVVQPRTIINYSYYEITLSGLLTPVGAGSPLQSHAYGVDISVGTGNNSPV